MVIAYLRVSTEKQDISNQRHEINKYVSSKNIVVDKWIEETVSGTVERKERQLETVMCQLGKGDMLIITEISRLSRTLLDILTIVKECVKKGIGLYSVKDGYTFDNSINSTVLLFAFGLVSEVERQLISSRTKAALASRKAEGKILGRPTGSSPKTSKLIAEADNIRKMLNKGYGVKKLCNIYDVSYNTFNRFRKVNL